MQQADITWVFGREAKKATIREGNMQFPAKGQWDMIHPKAASMLHQIWATLCSLY
jgi:hypothetical protein